MKSFAVPVIVAVAVVLSGTTGCAQPAPAPAPDTATTPDSATAPDTATAPGTATTPDSAPAPSTTPTPGPERPPECEPSPYPTVLIAPELKPLVDQGLLDPCLSLNPFCGNDGDLATKPDGTPYTFALSWAGQGGGMRDYTAAREWHENLTGYTETIIGYGNGGETINMGAIDYPPPDPAIDPLLYGPMQQIYFIEELISVIKPEALLIQAINDGEMIAPAAEQAADAGIAIFSFGYPAIGASSINSYVYNDLDGEFGCNLLGQYFVQLADQTGQDYHILEIEGFPGSSYDQACHDGFHMGLAGDPRIHVIESGYTGYKDNHMKEAVIEYFTANPELNGVYVHGGGTYGAMIGLKEIGRYQPTGHPEHVVFTANDPFSYTFDDMEKGFVDAFITNGFWELADITVKNSFHVVVLGQSVIKDLPIPMDMVTLDNINSLTRFGCTPIYTKLPLAPGGVRWARWPVLDTSEIGVDTPTKVMRMELMGY